MKNVQVVWRGPVRMEGGYGTASREYVLALARQGIDVKIEVRERGTRKIKPSHTLNQLIHKPIARNKRKILIFHGIPPRFNVNKARKGFHRIILNTVWETSRIPPHWVPIINKCHAVCVPSAQNKKALISSGVKVPIYIVPHGVDTHVFTPANEKLPFNRPAGTFIFVSVFGFQHRKNPETLLRAFWEEFTSADKAMLVIKTSGYNPKDTHARIKQKIRDYKKRLGFGSKTAPVVLIPGYMKKTQLKKLYRLGNAFVLPTRGEGVGLPFLESLASGVPVIATGWGGHMDFLDSSNAFLIDYRLRPPADSMKSKHAISRKFPGLFARPGQLWAEASVSSLRRLMRYAYEHPELCKMKGAQGRKDALRLSWNRSGAIWKRVIRTVADSN